jgi:hypothetical protein
MQLATVAAHGRRSAIWLSEAVLARSAPFPRSTQNGPARG